MYPVIPCISNIYLTLGINGQAGHRDLYARVLPGQFDGTQNLNHCSGRFIGRTPLMEACRKRFETVVEGLLAAGADLRARDARGRDVWEYMDQAGGDVSMLLWTINSADTERRERLRASTVRNLRAYVKNGIVVVHYELTARRLDHATVVVEEAL